MGTWGAGTTSLHRSVGSGAKKSNKEKHHERHRVANAVPAGVEVALVVEPVDQGDEQPEQRQHPVEEQAAVVMTSTPHVHHAYDEQERGILLDQVHRVVVA